MGRKNESDWLCHEKRQIGFGVQARLGLASARSDPGFSRCDHNGFCPDHRERGIRHRPGAAFSNQVVSDNSWRSDRENVSFRPHGAGLLLASVQEADGLAMIVPPEF